MKRFFAAFLWVACGAMGTAMAAEHAEDSIPTPLTDSIVVTANRFGLTPKKSVWPTALVTHETLAGEVSLETALDGAAGLDIRNYNGFGSLSTLSNWGVYNRHMLLLYNGRAVKDYSLGGFNLSDFSVGEIERVEILKGPQSAFYGADAVGGVVNIITRTALVDRLNVGVRQGTDGLAQYHIDLSRRVNPSLGFGGYAELSEADNNRSNAGASRLLFNLRSDYLSPDGRHRVSMTARYFRDSLGVPGPEPDPEYIPAYGNAESWSLYDHQQDENYSVDWQYRLQDERLGDLQLDLFWEKKNLDYRSLYNYQFSYTTVDSSVSPPEEQLNVDSVDVHARSIFNKRSSGFSARYLKRLTSLDLAGGVDWLSGSIRATTDDRNLGYNIAGPYAPYSYSYDSYNYWYGTQNQFDLWSNAVWQASSRLGIDLSGRAQFVYNRPIQSSYDIGVIMAAAGNLRFKVGYAYAFRLPSIAEQFAEDVFTSGNDKLHAETSHSVIGTVAYDDQNRKIRSSATVFYQTVDSLIQYQFDAGSFQYVPRNVNRFRATGVDLDLAVSFSGNFLLTGNFVIQNAEQTLDSGDDWVEAFYVPSMKARVGLSDRHGSVSYGLNLGYTSERSIVLSGSEKTIESVLELGAHIGLAVLPSVKIVFIGYDLTDQRRPDQFGFSLTDGDYPSPGRRFVLAVDMSLL